MSYQALYRAWRPQTFADLIGQPHVKQTLQNAIARNRVAHAYLFTGPRGTGKTSAAKVLAKAVNCLNPQNAEPCNQCEACLSITNGSNVDVEEIDAASNRGVDEIRQLRDKVQYAPTSVNKKVYIVDEVHMLTTEAFNALLKTLEEPPAHTLFVLATTEPHKIPPTIISRCQRFDFRRHEPEVIVEHLKHICADKQWTYDEEALWRVAEAADGGLRDALGLLEQTAAYARGHLTAEDAAHVMGGVQTSELLHLVDDLAAARAAGVMRRLMAWYAGGKDAARIVHEVLQLIRDLFIVKLCQDVPAKRFSEDFQRIAENCSEDWLLLAMQKLGEAYVQLRYVDQPRLALETSLLGLVPRQPAANETAANEPAANSVAAVPAQKTTLRPDAGLAPKAEAAAVAQAQPQSQSHHPSESAPVAATFHPVAESSATAETFGGTEPLSEPVAVAQEQGARAHEHRVAQPTQAQPAKPTERPARRPVSTRTPAARKTEVLKRLLSDSQPGLLERVLSDWENILQSVRQERITTHAWLMNGSPVLATPNTVVLSFSSRIHRDAVMKPEERPVIEQVMSNALGGGIQVLALLQADWDAFMESVRVQDEPETVGPGVQTAPDELVEKVVSLFGRELVEVHEEE